MSRIRPVILAGGPGARLWPASDAARPKPFLKLDGRRSLLGLTIERVADASLFAPPIVACAASMADLARSTLAEEGLPAPDFILEPEARDTAAAIAAIVAARQAAAPDERLLILPADHMIDDVAAFRAACARGADAAEAGRFVLFGVTPTTPHTGYGYIQVDGAGALADVAAFEEKPVAETAQRYLAGGVHLWNAGMFMASVATFAAAFAAHAPDIFDAAREAVSQATTEADALWLDAAAFSAARKAAFDRAVVEALPDAAVVRLSCGWSDVGAWDAVYDLLPHDEHGNATVGPAALVDAEGVLVSTSGPAVAAFGVKDIVIIASPHGVLVCPRSEAQRVKEIVARLKS